MADAERIAKIHELGWIENPQAAGILAKMQDLFEYPIVSRTPGLLICGEPNSGKTRIAQRFCELHPHTESTDTESAYYPVVAVEAPPEPSERRLYARLCRTFYDFRQRTERVDELETRAFKLLNRLRVRVAIIDEAQHVIAGSHERKKIFWNVVKSIGNQLHIVVILVGTPETAFAIEQDEQMKSRFPKIEIRDWPCNEDFRALLNTFAQILPLHHRSLLTDPVIVTLVHKKTGGRFGRVCDFMKRAAVWAIKTRKEFIDLELLEALPEPT